MNSPIPAIAWPGIREYGTTSEPVKPPGALVGTTLEPLVVPRISVFVPRR